MNSRLSSSSSPFLLLPFSLLLVIIKFAPCWSLDLSRSCSNRFACGNITDIDYPFWGDGRLEGCGYPHLHLYCNKSQPTIDIMDVKYKVLNVGQNTQILQISRDDFIISNGLCSPTYPDTTFDFQLFEYDSDFGEVTIHYDCPSSLKGKLGYFPCPDGSTHENGFIGDNTGCNSSLKIGIGRSYFVDIGNFSIMEEALIREGFRVKYKVNTSLCNGCTKSGGVCGYDWDSKQPTCYDGSSRQSPFPPPSRPRPQIKDF
ncbi:LEAF RUST 10 DISEASE-RESISTANCE LOCUS RECEPTOR-LIKE PROTEIN KINASE-like 1.3 [Ziziphus jujuba]|uniref:non-specific serine/threonine protein kinase n=1 Tax=Ziziphus jujuba TaxID=326968 RepID=A0ABM4A6S1_ZIZJJ|nr:LEAF RUST 10 DISEASE-RESISTANCE LOCUS RECEPTOR-LIKE PROTEIN KINASE-like 1.3 [Ziziphus jujuba]